MLLGCICPSWHHFHLISCLPISIISPAKVLLDLPLDPLFTNQQMSPIQKLWEDWAILDGLEGVCGDPLLFALGGDMLVGVTCGWTWLCSEIFNVGWTPTAPRFPAWLAKSVHLILLFPQSYCCRLVLTSLVWAAGGCTVFLISLNHGKFPECLPI